MDERLAARRDFVNPGHDLVDVIGVELEEVFDRERVERLRDRLLLERARDDLVLIEDLAKLAARDRQLRSERRETLEGELAEEDDAARAAPRLVDASNDDAIE